MSLTLTDFMQTVSLQDPKNPKSFLVFANEEGEELRVPVGPEAIQAITRFAFGSKKMAKPPVPDEVLEEIEKDVEDEIAKEEDPDESDASEFGGDVAEGETDEGDDPLKDFELPPAPDAPDSEESVPSL